MGKDGFFYQEAMRKDEKIRRMCMRLVEMMVVMGKDRMIQLPEDERAEREKDI